MFQNDFNFYYQDFTLPVENPLEKLALLKEDHDGNSTACPFLLRGELIAMQGEIPKSWSLEIDESLTVSSAEVRVTVYNKYEEADRYLDMDLENVRLIAEPVGGDFLCISQVCGEDGERPDSFFELDSASGSSPIMILITSGRDLKQGTREFAIDDMEEAASYLMSLI